MTVQQEAVSKLRDFLASCRVQEDIKYAKMKPCFHGTVMFFENTLQQFFYSSTPCHQGFLPHSGEYLALGTSSPIINRNDEIAKRFHNWFFSLTHSPWRELLKYGVEFVDLKQTGKMGAFILGPDLCKEIGRTVDWYAIKNMFITARCIYEKTEYLKVWYDLLDNGIPPDVAFLTCTLFRKEEDKYKFSSTNLNGHHWGITLEDVDLINFRNGNCNQFTYVHPTNHLGRINCVFKGKKDCRGLKSLFVEKLVKEYKVTNNPGYYDLSYCVNDKVISKSDLVGLTNEWMKGQ